MAMDDLKKWNEFQQMAESYFHNVDEALDFMNQKRRAIDITRIGLKPDEIKRLKKIASEKGMPVNQLAKNAVMIKCYRDLGKKIPEKYTKGMGVPDDYNKVADSSISNEDSSKPVKSTCSVYFMKQDVNGYTKIGISKDPKFREQTLMSQEPVNLIFTYAFESRKEAKRAEQKLHKLYKGKHVRGEWYNLDTITSEAGVGDSLSLVGYPVEKIKA